MILVPLLERLGGGLRLVALAAGLVLSSFSAPLVRAQADALDRAPSRFAMFDGMRVHFKSLGTGRTAVVFVHCWACDLTVWRRQIEAVAGRSRVVLVDLPGHGRSAKPNVEYSVAFFARAVQSVLAAAGVRRAVLVGHSMGVPVIREVYRRDPALVLGLVVVDGALRRPTADQGAIDATLEQLGGPDHGQVVARMIENTTSESIRPTVMGMARPVPQHVLVGAMRGMLDPSIWRDDPIGVPLLVVVAKGPRWPAEYRNYVEGLASDLRYEEMEGVGHYLMLEQPTAFNSYLSRFLSAVGVQR